jgi:hypothetical protein
LQEQILQEEQELADIQARGGDARLEEELIEEIQEQVMIIDANNAQQIE